MPSQPIDISDPAPRAASAPKGSVAAPPAGAAVLPRTRFGLRLKLIALAVLVSVVPLGAIGIALININRDALEQANQELLSAVIDSVADSLERSLVQVQDSLDAVARNLADPSIDLDTRVSLAIHTVSGSAALSAVGIYDGEGKPVDTILKRDSSSPDSRDAAGTHRAGAGSVQPSQPYQTTGAGSPLPPLLGRDLLERARTAPPALGRAELVNGSPRMLMVVPIRGQDTLWFAAAYLDIAPIDTRIQEIAYDHLGAYRHALFLLDRELRVLAHSDPSVERLSSMQGQGILAGVDARALGSDSGVGLSGPHVDAAGEPTLAVLRSLPRLSWAIGAQIPRAQAYASLARMRTVIIGVIAVVMGISLLCAVLLAAHLTAPIKRLVAFAGDLAQRRFDRRVAISTRDELAVLGNALSGAASELQAGEQAMRRELEIRSDLGRYLPAPLVDKIVRRKQDVRLGGERREITVMFADVASFTPLAERCTPEEVVAILNQLFTILTEVIFRHGGTVDKFIGDCVMAIWGAPTPQEDHARRAMAAAEDMLRWLELANESWQQTHGITIHLAIGMNSGEAIVGNLGSESRMEYTAIGDTVNVAARLESLARPQQILVAEATIARAGGEFEYLVLGPRKLPGRMEPVTLYELRP